MPGFPSDDINNSLIRTTHFTTNPQADQPPPPPAPSSSSSSSSHPPPTDGNPSSGGRDLEDPPPHIPEDIENPTPTERLALDTWLNRNKTYLTTIPWHRYPTLPLLSPFWGYHDADYHTDVVESLLFYTCASGRRLTVLERDAVLEPITRTAVAASYDRPLAIGLAAWWMVRSWNKSGVREAQRRAAAAAAAAAAGDMGHITHFSTPQPRISPAATVSNMVGGGGQILGALLRRVARTSLVGLSCIIGYQTLWSPWRFILGNHEVETIREDMRLERMVSDMDQNLASKALEILRRQGS